MTNTNNMMITPLVASHIAYLINHADCAEISMRMDGVSYLSEEYKRAQASWCLAVIRLGEYGIELPNLDRAKELWALVSDERQRHATIVTRTLEDHIEVEA